MYPLYEGILLHGALRLSCFFLTEWVLFVNVVRFVFLNRYVKIQNRRTEIMYLQLFNSLIKKKLKLNRYDDRDPETSIPTN